MTSARRLIARAALVLLVTASGVALAPAPASAACGFAFSAAFKAQLAQRYPGVRITAAVYDTATGCWHHLNPGMQLTTASVIKAQVLGAVLLKAQDEGRNLTAWERSQISPMIRLSFNTETSNLYSHLASSGGIQASDRRLGATGGTVHVRPFGLTRSTATDRTNVALRLLRGGGGLAQAGREEAWAYMTNVHPLQEWGISAGVPVGWMVAQKNGFYPSSGLGWRVGSSGFVRRDDADQGYAITVMTEGAATQATGIRAAEEVSRRAAAALTVGPGASRPIDRARCVTTGAGESWAGVAARLGLPGSRAGDIRTAAGGNPSPLSGQQACSPVIPAEVRSSTSSVNGHFRPVVTDLDCDARDDILWYAPGTTADFRWSGQADRGFGGHPMTVNGDYSPVGGDFDGDGCGDVLWYGAGSRPDVVWYGGPTVTVRVVSVTGLGYAPVSGDFDDDGRDDVLWYRPGSGTDYVWYGRATKGTFAGVPVTVNLAYDPVGADLDGDGADDVYWYARGSAPEAVWRGLPGQQRFGPAVPGSVNGAYRPVSADLDGDDRDEVVWYAPGDGADFEWEGLPSSLTSTPVVINGDYLPLSGDFDGDGFDDIAWYGPGGATDWVWWGRADGSVASVPLRAG